MELPSGLKYSREHEWVRVEENTALIGITDFAQAELGDVVYVELPEVGLEVEANNTFGVVGERQGGLGPLCAGLGRRHRGEHDARGRAGTREFRPL